MYKIVAANLDTLPDEILLFVVRRLSFKDRSSLSRINAHFNHLINHTFSKLLLIQLLNGLGKMQRCKLPELDLDKGLNFIDIMKWAIIKRDAIQNTSISDIQIGEINHKKVQEALLDAVKVVKMITPIKQSYKKHHQDIICSDASLNSVCDEMVQKLNECSGAKALIFEPLYLISPDELLKYLNASKEISSVQEYYENVRTYYKKASEAGDGRFDRLVQELGTVLLEHSRALLEKTTQDMLSDDICKTTSAIFDDFQYELGILFALNKLNLGQISDRDLKNQIDTILEYMNRDENYLQCLTLVTALNKYGLTVSIGFDGYILTI